MCNNATTFYGTRFFCNINLSFLFEVKKLYQVIKDINDLFKFSYFVV